MNRIAIMQPYFLPYAGYFRLLVGVDAFVVADVQQYSRGSWVNRNRLRNDAGELAWLTLPLRRQPLDTAIRSLRFADHAVARLAHDMRRFEACRRPRETTTDLVAQLERCDQVSAPELIVNLLHSVARRLGLTVPILLQSELGLPDDLRGAEHLYTICHHLGAQEYVNSPGGRGLYDAVELRRRGLRLLFLDPYPGDPSSILQRLHELDPGALRAEIVQHSQPRDG